MTAGDKAALRIVRAAVVSGVWTPLAARLCEIQYRKFWKARDAAARARRKRKTEPVLPPLGECVPGPDGYLQL
jgi:hypothetical protein